MKKGKSLSKIIKSSIFVIGIFLLTSLSVKAATSDALVENRVKNSLMAQSGVSFDTPFVLPEGNVDTSTGAVVVREKDLSLPGKNGFDLNIYREYSSFDSGYSFEYREQSYKDYWEYRLAVPYNYVVDGKEKLIYISCPDESYIQETVRCTLKTIEGSARDAESGVDYINHGDLGSSGEIELTWNRDVAPDYIYKRSYDYLSRSRKNYEDVQLDNGWHVNIPYISEICEYISSDSSSKTITCYISEIGFEDGTKATLKYKSAHYYKDGDVPAYDELWSADIKNDAGRYSIDFSDTIIESEYGFSYNLKIIGPEGRTYFFLINNMHVTADGKIKAVADRFGNIILYEKIGGSWLITDTYGRKITVTQNGISVEAGDMTKSVQYQRETIDDLVNDPNDYYYTFDTHKLIVTESDGTNNTSGIKQTVYTMKNKPLPMTLSKYYSQDEHIIPILLEIQYPTNVRREYEYNEEADAPQWFFSIADVDSTYSINDYDTYKVSQEKVYQDDILISDMQYTYDGTWEYKSGNKNYFDVYKTCIVTETLENGHTRNAEIRLDSFGKVLEEETKYKLDRATLDTKLIKYSYAPVSNKTDPTDSDLSQARSSDVRNTRVYENDILLSSTDTLYNKKLRTAEYVKQGEIENTCEFDETYSILLSNTTKGINGESIKEVNTLTDDKKNIFITEIYENDVKKTTTEFEYNSDGTIKKSTTENGDNDIVIDYSYEYADDCSYTVTKTIRGVKNPDGDSSDISVEVGYDSLGQKIYEKDGNGNTTEYVYDAIGSVIKQINPDGTYKQVSYDIPNNDITVTDENGNATTKAYSSVGLLEKVYYDNNPENALYEYAYDNKGRLLKDISYMYVDTPGMTYEYTYDDLDRVATKTTKGTNETFDVETYSYEVEEPITVKESVYSSGYELDVTDYDKAEVIFYDTNVSSGETYFDYTIDIDGVKTISGMSKELAVFTYTFDVSDAQKLTFDAADGSYYVEVRLLPKNSVETLMGGASTKVTTTYQGDSAYVKPTTVINYDGYGNKVSESYYSGDVADNTLLNKNEYKYDYRGNVIQTRGGRVLMEDLGEYSTKTEYDYANRPVKEYRADGEYISNTYDSVGNLISSTDYMGNTTNYTYDALGRLIKTEAPFSAGETSETLTYYDANGNIILDKLQNNLAGGDKSYSVTEYEYDVRNNLTSIRVYDGTRDIYTQFAYDNMGNMIKRVNGQTQKIKDLNGELPLDATYTLYEYDRFGNVTKETDALGNSNTVSYYNLYGNPEFSTDKNGSSFENTYNEYGSPICIYEEGEGFQKLYSYNVYNMETASTDYTNGSMCNTATTYDVYGYPNLKVYMKLGYRIDYTNDVDGNIKSMALKRTVSEAPILMSAEYTYDILNRLTNISFDNGSSISYTYDKNGNVLSESVNGSVTEFQYNNAGLLTRQTGNGTTYEMFYRLNGNKISETWSGNIKEYVYNDIGQLMYEYHWDNGNIEWSTISYTYDSRGNRLTKNEDGSIDQYTYDRGNRLTSISQDNNSKWISYTYDNNGNMLTQNKGVYEDGVAVTDESSAYTYDTFNRLTGVTSGDNTISYIYNADNERISKTVNGITTDHMWDRGNIVYEADASKNEIERYYYGRRLAESVAGDESKQYDYDPHGSVTHINGEWLYDYDTFGNLRMNVQDISKHLYCGEYYDAETGFIYLRNRYYDPSIGRFITEDPIKDGLNWYVYCENNPVNFVDPLGLEYLVVSGSEYDGIPMINSRYKYNFVEPAIKKIKELKALNDGEKVTWIISTTAYTEESLKQMNDIADDLGVGFIKIDSAAQLQNYINSQDINTWELSQGRKDDPIRKFTVFAHGVPGRVELAHNLPNSREMCIDFTFIQGMFSEAFKNPNTAFYSCRAGTNATSQWGSNLAQDWVNRVGGQTWAATSRTDYAYMLNGEGEEGITNRSIYGFNINGSPNYPIASGGDSAWMNFYRPDWFVNY